MYKYTFVCTHVLEDKHTLTLTIHFVKCCVLCIKFWIINPRKYRLKSSAHYFIKHARPFMVSDVGVDICKWLTVAGMQGWTMQGGAGGPSLHFLTSWKCQLQSTCLLPSPIRHWFSRIQYLFLRPGLNEAGRWKWKCSKYIRRLSIQTMHPWQDGLWLRQWGPTESRSKNNLASFQYPAPGEMYFHMWDVTSTPVSWSTSMGQHQTDHSPRRSWSKFTVGLKSVTLCVAMI